MTEDEEFKEAISGQHCEFEYDGKKCKSTEIVGIARTRYLCKVHLKTVTNDNNRCQKKDIDIPEDFTFTRKLMKSETWSNLNKLKKRREKWE